MTFEQIQQAIQHASASVSEMHQNLKAFFSALPDPFFIIDIDGNYVEVLGGNDESLYADGS